MIIVKDLKKYYNNNLVLDIGYFKFEKGKTYLLLGGNGSGKSTLIKSIIGLIKYEGSIEKSCKHIGYVPERFPEISLISAERILNNLAIDKKKTIRGEIIGQFSSFFKLDLKKILLVCFILALLVVTIIEFGANSETSNVASKTGNYDTIREETI